MTTTQQPKRALNGFEIAREIASWLSRSDEEIALRVIRRHETAQAAREAATAGREQSSNQLCTKNR